MKLLFYRRGNMYETDILEAFSSFQLELVEYDIEIQRTYIDNNERIRCLTNLILLHKPNIVFSVNYFPYISEICVRMQILYVCWTVDCPVLELYSSSLKHRTNRIFLFDYGQYQRFYPVNPDCIYYLPLAANTSRWENIIMSMTEHDIVQYGCDVSFVGSLYSEKSPLNTIPLSEYDKGYVEGLIEAQLKITGYNIFEDTITDEFVNNIKPYFPSSYRLTDAYTNTDCFVTAHYYLSMKASETERIRTLNLLAAQHNIDLYTRSDTSPLINVSCHDGVETLTQMPKIFALSKINLNITMRSIQTGLSQRIWDILGCGGFLLSNYQAEIPEYFEIGTDLDCFENPKELLEKVQYYLTHEDIREEMAYNGYAKVIQAHTYRHRIEQLLRTILSEA